MKKDSNEEAVMAKEDDENFENSTKCWICDSTFAEGDNKVRDNFLVTGICRVLHTDMVLAKSV